ncbi:MAG: dephospho-CoA kinase [Pseudomonadota bacterium]
MHILGLTGSIGMGKSTTADFFRQAGVPVHDADAVVHEAYSGVLTPTIEAAFPGTTTNGVVDRRELSARLKGLGGSDNLKRLEAIVHPHVRSVEEQFRETGRRHGEPLIVLDIPLLFETNREGSVDSVLVVTAPEDVQRQRVLARPDMTEDKLTAILARQMTDADKRARADHIIDTSHGLAHAKDKVQELIEQLTNGS